MGEAIVIYRQWIRMGRAKHDRLMSVTVRH